MPGLRSSATRAPIAPLAALFALAVLVTAWVASSYVCSRPIAMRMADMTGVDMTGMNVPGMPMPAGTVMICPVVLALIGVVTALSAWTLVAASRDPHRAVTQTIVARALARLPVASTFALLSLAGGTAIAAIVALDGHALPDPATCALLALLAAGTSIVATLCARVIAGVALALGARVLIALAASIEQRPRATCVVRRPPARPRRIDDFPTAFGRGLRAPPLPGG